MNGYLQKEGNYRTTKLRNQRIMKLREGWHQLKGFMMTNVKVRLILILCAILLAAGLARLAADRILYREADITDAFATADSACIESRLQVTADYGNGFLTEHDKQALAAYIANALGIQMEGAAEYKEDDASQIYTYVKEAKQAKTTIKVITLQEDMSRTYLYTELVIYDDLQYDILAYRDMLQKAFEGLKAVQVETTMQLLGAYEGQLALSEWDRITDAMVEGLDGRVIYENRDTQLYTIYAYTKQLPEYIRVENRKINMQVAMRYEEDNDRTVVYLATPLIRGDW